MSPAAEMARAALMFIEVLTPDQRARVVHPFPSPERSNWH
jgi:hypothetical protein